MKFIATCVMLAGLLGAVGCTNTEKVPDQTQAKRLKNAQFAEEDNVPAAVAKLLPPDQIHAGNARPQAKVLAEQLEREKGQLERTESAMRD